MTVRSVVSLVVAIATGVLLSACAQLQSGSSEAHYAIEKRFTRGVDEDSLGIRVGGLKAGLLSDAQASQLSTFLADLLRESGQFSVVINLTGNDLEGDVELIVEVGVTVFQVANEQQRSQGVKSQLEGSAALIDRETKQNRGLAKVSADGVRLQVVGKTRPPDTVIAFSNALLELLQ